MSDKVVDRGMGGTSAGFLTHCEIIVFQVGGTWFVVPSLFGGKVMVLIQWNNSFSVNVVEIDKQHQKLIGIINDLDDAMSLGKGKDIFGKIINGLINYAGIHFKTEERYFDQFGYPEANDHKKLHSDFVKKISEFKVSFETGKFGLTIEVMNFLSDWLQNHIKGADMKYGHFFNENGLK